MKLWSGTKKRMVPVEPFDPDPESRRKKQAIKCAQHFQRIGQGLIKGGEKKVNFQKMSLPEIDAWIHMVTEALGIKQFNKPKF